MRRVALRLPLDPLLDLYDSRLGLARALKVDPRQIQRWLRYGVSFYAADELAVSLGFHPIELWPQWMEVGEEAERQRVVNRRARRARDAARKRVERRAA